MVIADIPYNLGVNAYASNPEWYIGGSNKNGKSFRRRVNSAEILMGLRSVQNFTQRLKRKCLV